MSLSSEIRPIDLGDQTEHVTKSGAPVRSATRGLAAFLSGRHPRKTAVSVSAETGIDRKTIERWLFDGSKPSFEHFVRLTEIYGPAVLAAVLTRAPAWLAHAVAEQQRRETEKQIASVQRKLEELKAQLPREAA